MRTERERRGVRKPPFFYIYFYIQVKFIQKFYLSSHIELKSTFLKFDIDQNFMYFTPLPPLLKSLNTPRNLAEQSGLHKEIVGNGWMIINFKILQLASFFLKINGHLRNNLTICFYSSIIHDHNLPKKSTLKILNLSNIQIKSIPKVIINITYCNKHFFLQRLIDDYNIINFKIFNLIVLARE